MKRAADIIHDDLIRLHTELVEFESGMSERGECEKPHIKSVCKVDAVAIATYKCDTTMELVCSTYVAYISDSIRANDHACDDCKRPIANCWSVVMLP